MPVKTCPFLFKLTDYYLLCRSRSGFSLDSLEIATANAAFSFFVGNDFAFLADNHALQVDLLDFLVAFALGRIAFLERALAVSGTCTAGCFAVLDGKDVHAGHILVAMFTRLNVCFLAFIANVNG